PEEEFRNSSETLQSIGQISSASLAAGSIRISQKRIQIEGRKVNGERMVLRKTMVVCMLLALGSVFVMPSSAVAQGSAINGRATDVGGAALRNVEVSLVKVQPVMPGMTMAPPAPIIGQSNPDGTFVVNAVPGGDYILQVDAPGYERFSQQITIPANQTFNVKL